MTDTPAVIHACITTHIRKDAGGVPACLSDAVTL